jgi:hypothetical protein
VLFDDFANDTQRIYSEILQFLGVDPTFTPSFEVANATAEKRLRNFKVRQLLKTSPLANRLSRLLPPKPSKFVGDVLAKLTGSEMKKPPKLDPALRQQLMREFKPEVERLGDLIGQDLLGRWYDTPANQAKAQANTSDGQ